MVINIHNALIFNRLARFLSLLLVNIAFAKLGFSLADIGQFELFYVSVSAISYFWISGFLNQWLSAINSAQRISVNNVYLPLLFLSITGALALAFFYINQDYWPWIMLYATTQFAPVLFEYILVVRKKPITLIIYGLTNNLLLLALVVWGLLVYHDYVWVIKGFALWAVINFIVVHFLLQYKAGFHFGQMKVLLLAGWPLAMSLFLGGFSDYIDAFVVNYLDSSKLALFRYGAKELPFVLMVSSSLGATMLAKIDLKAISIGLQELKSSATQLLNYFLPLAILLTLVSHWAFGYFFSPLFAPSATVFNVLLFTIAPRLLFPQTLLIKLGHQRLLLWSSGAELLVNLFLSLVFWNVFGLAGIALGTVIAFWIEKIILINYLRKKEHILLSQYATLPKVILFNIVLLITFLITECLIYA